MKILRFAAIAVMAVTILHPAAPAGKVQYESHTVQQGETLWGIASERYPDKHTGEMVDEIREANGGLSPVIQPGQEIKVPVE